MPITTLRGARRAAPLALVLATASALTACSGTHKTAATPTTGTSPAPSVSNDPRATQALAKAASTLATEKSFRFDATETVAAKAPTTSRLAGAVVRNQGVAYTLTVGRTTQVVRIKGATYVRKVPGRWAKLAKPRPVADPTASLTAILTGLTDTGVATASLGAGTATTTVAGTLTTTAAKAAGIPAGPQPAQVTVSIDPTGHVTRVTVHTVTPVGTSVGTQAGTSAVTVTLVTSYTAFDRVPALRAPR